MHWFDIIGLVIFPAGLILFILCETIIFIIKSHKEKHQNKKGILTPDQINRINAIIREMCDARDKMQLESFNVLQSGVVTKEYEEAAEKYHKLLFAPPKTLDWMEIPKSSKKDSLDEN